MKTSKQIRVRPLLSSDFGFIRRLASRQAGFTVPPSYVLWLLKRTNPDASLVADHTKYRQLAYVLAVLSGTSKGRILYVWQLAASNRGIRIGAIDVVLLALRDFVRKEKVRTVLFTVQPGSSKFRAIRRYAYSLSARGFRAGRFLPKLVSCNEREYLIKVV